MKFGFRSRAMVLGLPLLVLSLGCDGSSASSPPPAEMSRSQVASEGSGNPQKDNAEVVVVFNSAPKVTSMLSSSGQLNENTPVTLRAIATDPDGDTLGFAWQSSCSGTFDRADLAQVTFTANALPAETVDCVFEVAVRDARGGAAKGTLSLSTVPLRINIAPAFGMVAQSTGVAAPDEVVTFHATATDPEGQAITWTWKASAGALSDQVDDRGASSVLWKAATNTGAPCTITVTATDPEGASQSYTFKAEVAD
jgi:hypothetical protein